MMFILYAAANLSFDMQIPSKQGIFFLFLQPNGSETRKRVHEIRNG